MEFPEGGLGNVVSHFLHVSKFLITYPFKKKKEFLGELKKLAAVYDRIQAKKCRTSVPSVWLNELSQCCYEVEDIIDSINLKILEGTSIQVLLGISVERIKKLRTELEKKLSEELTETDQASIRESESSWLEPCGCDFLREKNKKTIIENLKSTQTSGVSIIGMLGAGKTALARAILDDASIKQHFPIIEKPTTTGVFNVDNVIQDLKGEQLPGDERVLILLDGLQTVRPHCWYQFRRRYLKNLNPESKVLITSRNPEVANVTRTSKHHLDPLKVQECLQLIVSHAKAMNLSEKDCQAINRYQNDLADKCKESPLVACHLGLLLSSAEDPGEKLGKIARTDLWRLLKSEGLLPDLMPGLLVFQPNVERCLAYCSLFPQDRIFKKDHLTELWLAEGFVQLKPTDDASILQETASEYFDELLSQSVFQQLNKEERSYEMCKLIHDLAQNIASKIVRRMDAGTMNTSSLNDNDFSHIRHLSLCCEATDNIEGEIQHLLSSTITKFKGLRTFLLLHEAGKKITKNPTFFKHLECLRVLDLSHTNLHKVETGISELKHLRYLDLSWTPVNKLSSLTTLLALRVLKLEKCTRLNSLPKDFSKLTNLVCLRVEMKGLAERPPRIGKLTNLQTLDAFIVENKDGYQIVELRNMNNLRGSICISNLEKVKNGSEAREAMLNKKDGLETLELQWNKVITDVEGKTTAKEVLEGLQPPRHLKILKITNYSGTEFSKWLSEGEVLRHLVTIKLERCKDCTVLPSLARLQALETLHVSEMQALEPERNEFFGEGHSNDQPPAFPALKKLKLYKLPKLTQWRKLAPGCMPVLSEFEINNCESLNILPPLHQLTSLKELQIIGCPELGELPRLPLSLTSEQGRLIINDCEKVEEKCRAGGSDRSRIEAIPSVIINRIKQNPATARAPAVIINQNEGSSSVNRSPGAPESDPETHTAQDHPRQALVAQNEASSGANSSASTSEPVHQTNISQHEGLRCKQTPPAPTGQGNTYTAFRGDNCPTI